MKEYIKKFESAVAADNYVIIDIPFTSTVSGETLTNLVCNEENKKIVVDGQGNISIVDNIVDENIIRLKEAGSSKTIYMEDNAIQSITVTSPPLSSDDVSNIQQQIDGSIDNYCIGIYSL